MILAKKNIFNEKYTELEYITNTGLTQYIRTGIKPTNNTRFEIQFMTSSRTDTWSVLFGSTTSDNSPNSVLLRFYSGMDYLNAWFGQSSYPTPNWSTVHNTKHTVILKYGQCLYDDINYSISSNSLSSPQEIYLFAGDYNGFWRPQLMKCYYFKVYESDILVQYLIPVIDLDNIVCMYDKVSKQFFYNRGSGVFIAGPKI